MSPPIASPVSGLGGTLICNRDRHSCTVIRVLSPTRVIVRRDRAIRTDVNRMPGAQTHRYETDLSAPEQLFSRRKDGRWREVGGFTVLVLGARDEFYDFSL